MRHRFLLHWRRETGCDAGTPTGLEDLDPAIRPQVCELAAGDAGPIAIRLPFFDQREWRRRSETLRGVVLVRQGDTIRQVPADASADLRERAADAIGAHPAWLGAPVEREHAYFRVWRNVSVALQEFLRRAVPEIVFRDLARCEDRKAACALLVYQASRVCRGIPGGEFAYDVANDEALPEALRMIGPPLQKILDGVQQRLEASGRPELARRYAAVWYEDFMREVQERPRLLLALLGREAALIDAIITLGTARNLAIVKPFVRSVMATLRCLHGCDARELAAPLMAEATQALERALESTPARRRRATSRRYLTTSTGSDRSSVLGGRHIRSLQAW